MMALLLVILLSGFFVGPLQAADESDSALPPGVRAALERMAGETLTYDIAFLWFDRLAVAEFSLVKKDESEQYRAVLEARTLGVAAWLTGNRVQRYASDLFLAGSGGLRPARHDSDIYKGRGDTVKSRLKRWIYDYPRRLVVETVTRNGRPGTVKRHAMGDGALPYDILGAFYNFRAGLFGPIGGGAQYRVPSFAKGKPAEIGIFVYPANRRPRDAVFPEGGVVVRVMLDPEVFDTGDGNLYIWFDDAMRPARVLVKDVIGLGDVRATLQ